MRKLYAHYEKLTLTKALLDLPVTDILHVIKEINKQRFVTSMIEHSRLYVKNLVIKRDTNKPKE
jgi:hypothetical protein